MISCSTIFYLRTEENKVLHSILNLKIMFLGEMVWGRGGEGWNY